MDRANSAGIVLFFSLLSACSSSSSNDPGASGDLGNGVEPGAPALPAAPITAGKSCPIDLAKWKIANDGSNPEANTDALNAAIDALAGEGCGTIVLPAGTYAVGKKLSADYTGGIELPSGVTFSMEGATLKLAKTDTWAYCVIAVSAKHDVRITGGAIVGDRDEHDFKTEGEEGHCICVEDESERVAIDHVKLSKAIGDGVLIVAQGEPGSSCKDVSISDSELFENRRQGVSIVGGMRVSIERNEIHDIHGTAPQFGIDIESLKYTSREITIRDNRFHHNKGGDFVNTDGRAVLFERNTMEDGDGNTYVDGPVIFWSNTDTIIRENHVTMARGSANGKMGILEYSHKSKRTNPARTIIEGNELLDCSIDVMNDSLLTIRKNHVKGKSNAIILYQVEGVELFDNVLEKEGRSYSYMIHESSGVASGNVLNGEPYAIAMTPDAPWSNWDGN